VQRVDAARTFWINVLRLHGTSKHLLDDWRNKGGHSLSSTLRIFSLGMQRMLSPRCRRPGRCATGPGWLRSIRVGSSGMRATIGMED
jgi:hypothetical protein